MAAGVAVLGADPLGVAAGVSGAVVYPDVAGWAGALDGGAPLPSCAVLTVVTPDDCAEDPATAAHRHAVEVLACVQAWLAEPRVEECPLVVVTRRAVAAPGQTIGAGQAAGAGGDGSVGDLGASVVWGLVRSAQSEHPGRFVLLDVDDTVVWAGVLGCVVSGGEPQVAVRSGAVLGARLVRSASSGRIALTGGFGAGSDWRLDALGGGTLDDVGRTHNPRATRPLEPGEVRIQVRASGINFMDVAGALGLAHFPDGLGAEGSGVVVETGPGVERFAVGDRVMGGFPSTFAPLSIADERMITEIPADWTFEQAASVPAVFLTALYGLSDLAGLKAGERVLIHAAAGGVGMAAVQLARHIGAEVFATASPAKWPVLHAMGLDDDHIANSRTLEFADTFRTTTDGLDVVLGSLAGEHIDASLTLLRPGGRYIEMGKTDIRDPHTLTTTHPGRTYTAFDLKDAGPDRTHTLLTHLMHLFHTHTLHPLPTDHLGPRRPAHRPPPHQPRQTHRQKRRPHPHPRQPRRHRPDHRRHRHPRQPLRPPPRPTPPHPPPPPHLPTRTPRPRRHHPPQRTPPPRRPHRHHHRLRRHQPHHPHHHPHHHPPNHPLTAILHTTGALDDAMIGALTPKQVQTVLTAKVDSALLLHELTRDSDLGAFVLFSSAAGAAGQPRPGQLRRRQHLPRRPRNPAPPRPDCPPAASPGDCGPKPAA